MAEASSEKELTPTVRLAGSGTCLAAGARSLARVPSGPSITVGVHRADRNPREFFPLVDDKLRMRDLCVRIGVPTPEVFVSIDYHSMLRDLPRQFIGAFRWRHVQQQLAHRFEG